MSARQLSWLDEPAVPADDTFVPEEAPTPIVAPEIDDGPPPPPIAVSPSNGEPVQPALFDLVEPWRAEWQGMPEFIQEDLSPQFQVIVSFASYGDLLAFSKLVDQTLTPFTRSIWYPEAEIGRLVDKRYALAPSLPNLHSV